MLQGTYTDPDNKTVYTINRSYTYYTAPWNVCSLFELIIVDL
jgi:hypothetical protein